MVRHATPDDLAGAAAFLDRLRALPGVREARPGAFSRHGRALLHLHVDPTGLYADVRLDARFERRRVETDAERAALLAALSEALGDGPAGA